MRNFLFFFLVFLGVSCNPQTQQMSAQGSGCSFEPKILLNECGSALLGAIGCSDCTDYKWSNGASTQFISVTQSGTYKVTVTNSNICSSVAQIPVQVAPPCNPGGCSFNISETKECGKTKLEVMDCPDCFAYMWSNGSNTKAITVTTSGTYKVTVTGGNGTCTSVSSKTISINNGPSVQINGNKTFCEGESTTLTAVGPNNCYYMWSNGSANKTITVNNTGTYSVTVVDLNGCSAIATAVVTKSPQPQAPLISYEVIDGNKVRLTASPSAFYQWSNGATTPSITVSFENNSGIKVFSVKIKNHDSECWSEFSCPIPLIPVNPTCCGNGDDGSSPDNCNKNGIKASNGMPYGAVFTPTTSQLFLFAPNGATQIEWNHGQSGGDQGWILVSVGQGKHYYQLSCVINGKKMYYCFEYTCFYPGYNKPLSDDLGEEVDLSELEINYIEPQVQVEESKTETRSNSDYLINSPYMNNPNYSDDIQMKVYPTPTSGRVTISAEMEIPADSPPGMYFFKMFDVNGRPIGQPAKGIKQ